MNKIDLYREYKLFHQLKTLSNSHDFLQYIDIELIENNIFHWYVILYQLSDSIYNHGIYPLKLDFSNNTLLCTFLTPMFHPNIDKYGVIKMDYKGSIITLLLSIINVLKLPNELNPSNPLAALLYMKDYKKYIKIVEKYKLKYNKPSSLIYNSKMINIKIRSKYNELYPIEKKMKINNSINDHNYSPILSPRMHIDQNNSNKMLISPNKIDIISSSSSSYDLL